MLFSVNSVVEPHRVHCLMSQVGLVEDSVTILISLYHLISLSPSFSLIIPMMMTFSLPYCPHHHEDDDDPSVFFTFNFASSHESCTGSNSFNSSGYFFTSRLRIKYL
uniref:Ovule protein n=1 Tax=Globodera pallida TaxID=36090 RepID=A0A183C9V6_GLOPA